MSGGVPHGALGLSVIVLLYSFLCLFLGVLLFCVCWRHGARSSCTWTSDLRLLTGINYTHLDVSLIAAFASLACAASIAQQIHFATDWVSIKEAQSAARERDPTSPILIVTGSTQGADLGLFWIQFASYNSDSLLILFWFVYPLRFSLTSVTNIHIEGPPLYFRGLGSLNPSPNYRPILATWKPQRRYLLSYSRHCCLVLPTPRVSRIMPRHIWCYVTYLVSGKGLDAELSATNLNYSGDQPLNRWHFAYPNAV